MAQILKIYISPTPLFKIFLFYSCITRGISENHIFLTNLGPVYYAIVHTNLTFEACIALKLYIFFRSWVLSFKT